MSQYLTTATMERLVSLILMSIIHYTCCMENKGMPIDVLAPQKVRFISINYRNVLHWKKHTDSADKQLFFVQWKIYGEKHWTNADKCQGIRRLHCDLSQETSDPREWYYARVQATHSGVQSAWVLTARFNSKWETSVSPPEMKISVIGKGIVVRVKPPLSPYRRQNGSRISVRKLQKMSYTIYITQNEVEETYEIEGCAKELLISELSSRTTYCLEAESRLHLLDRRSTRSPKTCVTTP